MIKLHSLPSDQIPKVKRMLYIGLVSFVGLLAANFLMGNWFLKAIFTNHWGDLWTPARSGFVLSGLLLAALLIGASLLGFAITSIWEHQYVSTHSAPGRVINPPGLLGNLWGLAFSVGGGLLIVRYLFLLILVLVGLSHGVPANFSLSTPDIQIATSFQPLTEGEAEAWKIGPVSSAQVDKLTKMNWYVYGTNNILIQGNTVSAGSLILGDLSKKWYTLPVRPLIVAYSGGYGLFISEQDLQLDFQPKFGFSVLLQK